MNAFARFLCLVSAHACHELYTSIPDELWWKSKELAQELRTLWYSRYRYGSAL